MIGSGIFLVPATVAQNVPFISGIVLVWVIGGLFSGAGALTLAELGAMLPRAGGLYVFLRVAYGALPAFLFGWVEFLVVRSGSMATLAAAFARYFARLVPPPEFIRTELWQAGAATLAIAVVTAVNVMGTRRGGTLQIFGTVLKVGGVVVLIALPFLLGRGTIANLSPIWPGAVGGSIFTGMVPAMIGVLWAYDGWTNVTPLAEEIRDPGRNVPRALIGGMAVLIGVYLSMTLAYHYVLPMNDVASASRNGVRERGRRPLLRPSSGVAGSGGYFCLGDVLDFHLAQRQCIDRSACLFRDGTGWALSRRTLPSARSLSNAGQRDPGPGDLGYRLDACRHVLDHFPPTVAPGLPRLIMAAWKKLNETPLYDLLYTYVIFGANLFYMLAISSVFVLRVRRPDLPRPYRTWGCPVHPPALRGGGAASTREHARGPSEPGSITVRARHHPHGRAGLLALPVKLRRHQRSGADVDWSVTWHSSAGIAISYRFG